jgi:hypothetical protein
VFDAHGDAVRSVTFSADSKYTYQADSATSSELAVLFVCVPCCTPLVV